MRNETLQTWLLGKLVHEGLVAPPTGADRNAMNEFIRAVSKDARTQWLAARLLKGTRARVLQRFSRRPEGDFYPGRKLNTTRDIPIPRAATARRQ